MLVFKFFSVSRYSTGTPRKNLKKSGNWSHVTLQHVIFSSDAGSAFQRKRYFYTHLFSSNISHLKQKSNAPQQPQRPCTRCRLPPTTTPRRGAAELRCRGARSPYRSHNLPVAIRIKKRLLYIVKYDPRRLKPV